MRLFIEPTDMLMFRSGRPFDAGQDNFATSLFPPTPETMQGAVRAMIASNWDPNKNIAQAFNDLTLTNLIGDRNNYGRFRITGLSLGRYKRAQKDVIERLLPAPAHMIREKIRVTKEQSIPGKENNVLRIARVHLRLPNTFDSTTQTNFPEDVKQYLAPMTNVKVKTKPVEGWITENDLRRVLANEEGIDIEIVEPEDVYREEPRLGIVVQSGTKSTKEGFLYQTVMIRMNHNHTNLYCENPFTYGFVVDVELEQLSPGDALMDDKQTQETLHIPDSGWMTIGGEQRSAYFRVVDSSTSTEQQENKGPGGENTLIYMATPASFGKSGELGWLPPEPHNKPQTAAIENYTLIGGWKLNTGDARGENKAMRRCVPAGAVYFYEGKIDVPRTLTDYGEEIGYGITYKGEW